MTSSGQSNGAPVNGEPAEEKRLLAERFSKAGNALGKTLAGSLEADTRKAVQAVLKELQEEIARIRETPAPVPSDPSGSASRDREELQETLLEIDKQFRKAAFEWKSLLEAVEDVRREISPENSRRMFLKIFEGEPDLEAPAQAAGPAADRAASGSSGESAADRAIEAKPASRTPPGPAKVGEVALPSGSSRPASAEAPAGAAGIALSGKDSGGKATAGIPVAIPVPPPGAAPACFPEMQPDVPEAALEADPENGNLEHKLDELLHLVRNQLAAGKQPRPGLDALPEGWTLRIAREVVQRLKDNLPLAPASTAAGAGEPAGPRVRAEKQIALDDVSSMLDELNRRNS